MSNNDHFSVIPFRFAVLWPSPGSPRWYAQPVECSLCIQSFLWNVCLPCYACPDCKSPDFQIIIDTVGYVYTRVLLCIFPSLFRVPQSWSNLSGTLNQLDLAHNSLSGSLSPLAPLKLMYVSVHSNERLCGMVPASVRYASGYNPAGTRLGQPC